MKLQDLLLTPIYLAIFYGIAYGVRGKVTNAFTRRYFIPALTAKFVGAIALGLVYQFYYGGGDTFNYTRHVDIIYRAFGESPVAAIKLIFSHGEFDPVTAPYTGTMYWYKSATEFFVIRIAAVASLLSFNTYSVMALMFAGLSFSGMWAMYLTFIRAYPLLYKRFATAVFFLPSVYFWGRVS
ncbi:hypothetical protein [Hymenobacter cellulosilyticus]|uniref:Uncharacterized protein n=1 Tax=Hymenobacter cellulosilyticus TaxID=2932248 RepID=A0A8T9QA98_9BACT|nr:hypothetical protein [Hymenobacter cellulosilyticus]UOQ74437.1 hypothetical protein MUN79_11470 [Hymenobacter cellulosilyticus]